MSFPEKEPYRSCHLLRSSLSPTLLSTSAAIFPSQNESVSGRDSFLSKGSVSVEKLHEPKFSGQGTFLQAHINFSGLKWLSEARVQLYLGLPEFHPQALLACATLKL